jgi:undecaprenyl diphosphate synthase
MTAVSSSTPTFSPTEPVPKHVAIIMDGNRRWAKQQGLQLLQGHQKVARELIERLARHAIARKISLLTLWAFSTENWQRETEEVNGLMELFREAFQMNASKLHEAGVRLAVIGDLTKFPSDIQQGVSEWLKKTANNTALTVVFALNYGGRDELVRGVKKIVSQGTAAAEVTEQVVVQALDTAQFGALANVDLLIRPGGEQRLSGFLPWQSTYAELYFTPVLMPDFTEVEFDQALAEFQQRQRRFGA